MIRAADAYVVVFKLHYGITLNHCPAAKIEYVSLIGIGTITSYIWKQKKEEEISKSIFFFI